ncbi:MAG TPA: TonB-dependent receptor, partial [Candidatus Elarobacter sp.]|nr:TonB-dependent receptor [Candidatus Elarobacter sp.]
MDSAGELRAVRALLAAGAILIACVTAAPAAEETTAIVVGTVVRAGGGPIRGARIELVSPGGRSTATTDARGRFTMLGIAAGSYTASADAAGFTRAVRAVVVLPGETHRLAFTLGDALATIGGVRSRAADFTTGSANTAFSIEGPAARAAAPSTAASGLATYTERTVQGAIASVPGVQQDPFANAILRGGKVDDTVFEFDSVPVPQGLIAEPGGNVVGAQLPATGIAATTVTLAGYQAEGDNALGGIVDQIPIVGTYPARSTLEAGSGIGAREAQIALTSAWATPDLRWRYALAASVSGAALAYGDGRTFYPAEAGTYGLALSDRSASSLAANVHVRVHPGDDVSLAALAARAAYDQYGTPYAGETAGAFGGAAAFGNSDPSAPVTNASSVRGSLGVLKLQWLHTSDRALWRAQLYDSRFNSVSGGPYWDDLSFPDGPIALVATQHGALDGAAFDVETVGDARHDVKYGVAYRTETTFLDEFVPTAAERVRSRPTLLSTLAYLGDTWAVAPRLDVRATARFTQTHVVPSSGSAYDVAALDPHLVAVYRPASETAVRVTFDHTTVAPKPLEADRSDSAQPAPFVPLAPETQNLATIALEGGGRTQFRITAYAMRERNRIDVLPVNFRSVVSQAQSPSAIGVPTNAGELRARGVDAWVKRGHFTLTANALRGTSSSASQFAFNSLNAAAAVAGHLFPLGYVPALSGTAAYEVALAKHVRVTPSLSFSSGYPYGNGRMVWTFDAAHRPIEVPNDNHVNPGYSYYFLRDPSLPYDAASNPIVGSLGTPDG